MATQQRRVRDASLSSFHPSAWVDLPHLQNVFLDSKTSSCSITDIEYSGQWKTILEARHVNLNFRSNGHNCRRYVESFGNPEHELCSARLIIVQDICRELINCLVEAYNISPEMFEQHISGADWAHKTHHKPFDRHEGVLRYSFEKSSGQLTGTGYFS